MKPESHKGLKAREAFERTMTALYRVPKTAIKNKPKPMRLIDFNRSVTAAHLGKGAGIGSGPI